MKKAEIEQKIAEKQPVWFLPNSRHYGSEAECRVGESRWYGRAFPVEIKSRRVKLKGFNYKGKEVIVYISASKLFDQIPSLIRDGYLDDWWMYCIHPMPRI